MGNIGAGPDSSAKTTSSLTFAYESNVDAAASASMPAAPESTSRSHVACVEASTALRFSMTRDASAVSSTRTSTSWEVGALADAPPWGGVGGGS